MKALALHVIRHGGERRGSAGMPLRPPLGFSLGTVVAVEALEWENPDAESGKTSSRVTTSLNLDVVVVVFDVRNSGLKNVDGLGEVHRR